MEQGHMMQKAKKYGVWGLWALTAAYGLLCVYLFYMQSIQPLDYNNRYFQSDLPYHISMVIDDGWYYSFTAYLYRLLYFFGGGSTVLIAVVLAIAAAECVVLTERLLRKLLKSQETTVVTLLGALTLNFVMPFFFRPAGMYRYVSYQSGNIWHNSTYQFMKPAALAAMLLYISIEEHYREKISGKQWLLFAGLLVLTTGIKPSFLTVFAPALALKLLWDLCHKVSFKQIFLLGSTVLPACLVLLWQNGVLFGTDTGNGITFSPWYAFSLHADRPKLAVLCSLAFPLVVLFFSFVELWKDKNYCFAWLMTVIGFLEALCLVETGARSRDGNFLWGYSFALCLIYTISFIKWVKNIKRAKDARDRALKGPGTLHAAAFLLAGAVFAYQLFCGLIFFVRLLQGETYFMIG